MSLHDPAAVYNAASNMEAHFLRQLLMDRGVEAFVTEDISVVGLSMFGPLSEIHKPQVWVERDDIERARLILEEYERHAAERRAADAAEDPRHEPTVAAVCEECGQRSVFPSGQRGSVQECPHCGAYLDVGEGGPVDEPGQTAGDEDLQE